MTIDNVNLETKQQNKVKRRRFYCKIRIHLENANVSIYYNQDKKTPQHDKSISLLTPSTPYINSICLSIVIRWTYRAKVTYRGRLSGRNGNFSIEIKLTLPNAPILYLFILDQPKSTGTLPWYQTTSGISENGIRITSGAPEGAYLQVQKNYEKTDPPSSHMKTCVR